MHPADISAAIKKSGKNQSILARELDVSPTAVRLVITGNSHSRRIADAISKLTGCSLDELWPGVYVKEAA